MFARSSEDLAITAPSRPNSRSGDADTAMSQSQSQSNSTANNVSIQAHQPEFDWISNVNAFQRLKHLITLKDNWDGYGAKGYSKQHIQRALDLFAVIQGHFNAKRLSFSYFSPFIAPCSDGAILFEWCGNRFPDRELEIFVPANLSQPFEYLKSTQDFDEEDSFIDPVSAHSLLEWLVETVAE